MKRRQVKIMQNPSNVFIMIKYKASKVISTAERQHTLQMVAVYQQWKKKNKK